MNRMVEERLEGKEWSNREVDMIEELNSDFDIAAKWNIGSCNCRLHLDGALAHYNLTENSLCFSTDEAASMPMVVLHEVAHYLNSVVNPNVHHTNGGHNRYWRDIYEILANEWNLGGVFEDFELRGLLDGYDDEEHFIEMLLHASKKTGTTGYLELRSKVAYYTRKAARSKRSTVGMSL